MCEKCHTDFDTHKIGIHPTDLRWIVINSMRKKSAPSTSLYKDIHGTSVVFTSQTYAPPLIVLEDRMKHFIAKNTSAVDKKTTHYCHFCLDTFTGVSGLADKEAHVTLCRVTTKARELTVL